MGKNKVRKVDLVADEFLVGVTGMTADEIGIYCVLNFLMYSSGGPVHEDDERIFGVIKSHPNAIRPAIARLVARSKIKRDADGMLFKTRVGLELDRADTRMTKARENGQTGGRPAGDTTDTGKTPGTTSEQNQQDGKPAGFVEQKLPEKLSPSPSPSLKEDLLCPEGHQQAPKGERKAYPEKFTALWAAYPKRGPARNPKEPAHKAWEKALKAGADPDVLISLAPTCAQPEKHGTPFVPMMTTWLNSKPWLDDDTSSQPATNGGNPDDLQWSMRYESYRRGSRWMGAWGAEPDHPRCQLPAHVRAAVDAKLATKEAA